MNTVEGLVQEAMELRKKDDREGALLVLSKAFDVLIDASAEYAKSQESTTDESELRTVTEKLLEHSTEFLKRNLTAAMVLTTMGILFSELEQYDAAYQKFGEAIAVIPDGEEYAEPFEHRETVSHKLQELYKVEQGIGDDFLE